MNIHECGISLQDQNNNSQWFVDSGYSKHIPSEKSILVTLKRDKGYVSFGNNDSTKVIEKVIVKLGYMDTITEKCSTVDNMNHNLLSVSQMCDQGHQLLFTPKEYKLRK